MERDFRPGLFRLAGSFQLGGRVALFVRLLPHLAIAPDFQIEPVGKRVDHRNADAVQSARNFVSVAIEFSARVQHGEDDFGGGLLLGGVHIDGNAAAIVGDGDAVIVVHDDVDLIAVARHRFVDGIVDHFPDEVVQAKLAGRADVHCRALANRFEASENFDRSSVVLVPACRRGRPGGLRGRSLFVTHGSCVSSVRAADCDRQRANSRSGHASIMFGKAVERKCATLARLAGLPCPLAPLSLAMQTRAGTRRVFLISIPPHSEISEGRGGDPQFPPAEGGARPLFLPRDFRLARSGQAPHAGKPRAEQSAVQEDSGTLKFYRNGGSIDKPILWRKVVLSLVISIYYAMSGRLERRIPRDE